MVWLGSASHVTVPPLLTLMYLYWITWPGVSCTETAHSGFDDVYWVALRATASLVSQLPRVSMFPVILIVSPYTVVSSSWNVTRTDVGVAEVDVLVVVVVVAVVVALVVVVL